MSKIFFESTTINVNNISSEIEIPILCPNHSRGCKSEHLVKNGHDTSVKEHPQYFRCKDCNVSFYAHTSAFFKEVELLLRDYLVEFFANGKFNMDGLQSILNCSKPTISRIFQQVINAVNASKRLIELWNTPKNARALFVDEIWINIDRQLFYLIVVVNEQKEVLAWDLVKHRTKERIISILKRVQNHLRRPISVLVTDDFSTYKGVATGLGYDLTQVRHVHQPPYGRMCIDLIRHEKKAVKTIHVATTNDIFKQENTFLVRVSESKKTKHETGKRGREAGGKNRPKKFIEAEKKRKRKKRKKGPKNPFRDAKTCVYHYYKKKGWIGALGNSNPEIAACLEALAKVFKGKCVTKILIEREFSNLKKFIDFRGNRSRTAWISTINFFFTVRTEPKILQNILKETRICPQTLNRLPLVGSSLLTLSKQIMSKDLKVEICQIKNQRN